MIHLSGVKSMGMNFCSVLNKSVLLPFLSGKWQLCGRAGERRSDLQEGLLWCDSSALKSKMVALAKHLWCWLLWRSPSHHLADSFVASYCWSQFMGQPSVAAGEGWWSWVVSSWTQGDIANLLVSVFQSFLRTW